MAISLCIYLLVGFLIHQFINDIINESIMSLPLLISNIIPVRLEDKNLNYINKAIVGLMLGDDTLVKKICRWWYIL